MKWKIRERQMGEECEEDVGERGKRGTESRQVEGIFSEAEMKVEEKAK